ncbi:MAG: hypothetical protein DMF89_20595 [Acidobacteria bacterium]|nr:MAG: hypothetical protein DMF89_20595 [Acidobacteriota bacterium]
MSVATGILLLLGIGFLVANLRLTVEYVRYLRRRRHAVLTWPGAKPPHYGLTLALGVVTGLLTVFKIAVVHRQAFGETMMFLYFGYLVPLSTRIGRGFYEDGIWADSTFIPYNEVGGLSWREGEHSVSLVVISRLRMLARRLAVPVEHYGAARRLLRDKIGQHEIHFSGTGLDLGARDERDGA